jgi:hypothetical protein
MPVLTVQNALVRSATVEIKSLTVSGRQVTQAVFRQVPYQQILKADGSLAGTPWGWVNYWWKDSEPWGEAPLHVLWQQGGELRRAAVIKPAMRSVRHYREGYRSRYADNPFVVVLGQLEQNVAEILEDRQPGCVWTVPPFDPFGGSHYGAQVAAKGEPPADVHELAHRAHAWLTAWKSAYNTCHAAGQLFIAC